MKNIRNTMKAHDIEFGGSRIASWADVANFFKYYQPLPVPLAPKLTCKNIHLPRFSKMRMNLAAQVCSRTVYAGIHTLVALGKMADQAKDK